jgi:uncharacterized RDD family membrane protein YckC
VTSQPPERDPGRPPADPQPGPGAGSRLAPGAAETASPASPAAPQAPTSPQVSDSTAPPEAPAPASAPAYPGPVPPGGWHQPVPRAEVLPPGLELAGWGRRLAARVLDVLALTVILLLLAAPGGVVFGLDPSAALGIVLLVVSILVDLVVWALYAPFLVRRHGRRNGQTLGKQWLGIRVIRTNGAPVDWGMGLLRELVIKGLLFNFIGFYFFATIPWLLNYLWPLWDDQNRALHDMMASTRVVKV